MKKIFSTLILVFIFVSTAYAYTKQEGIDGSSSSKLVNNMDDFATSSKEEEEMLYKDMTPSEKRVYDTRKEYFEAQKKLKKAEVKLEKYNKTHPNIRIEKWKEFIKAKNMDKTFKGSFDEFLTPEDKKAIKAQQAERAKLTQATSKARDNLDKATDNYRNARIEDGSIKKKEKEEKDKKAKEKVVTIDSVKEATNDYLNATDKYMDYKSDHMLNKNSTDAEKAEAKRLYDQMQEALKKKDELEKKYNEAHKDNQIETDGEFTKGKDGKWIKKGGWAKTLTPLPPSEHPIADKTTNNQYWRSKPVNNNHTSPVRSNYTSSGKSNFFQRIIGENIDKITKMIEDGAKSKTLDTLRLLFAITLTIQIMLKGYQIMAGRTNDGIREIAWDLGYKTFICVFMFNYAGYLDMVVNAIKAFHDWCSGGDNAYAKLDDITSSVSHLASVNYSNAHGIPDNFKAILANIVIYLGAGIAILPAMLLVITTQFTQTLLIIVAPFMFASLLFPSLKQVFQQWCNLLVTNFLTVLFVGLLFKAVNHIFESFIKKASLDVAKVDSFELAGNVLVLGIVMAGLVTLVRTMAEKLGQVGIDGDAHKGLGQGIQGMAGVSGRIGGKTFSAGSRATKAVATKGASEVKEASKKLANKAKKLWAGQRNK